MKSRDSKHHWVKQGKKRLSVFKSNRHLYAQLIDDSKGHVLLSSSTLQEKISSNVEGATKVGEKIAQLAKEKNISNIFLDRNNNKYHGKIKALAEAARKSGMEF